LESQAPAAGWPGSPAPPAAAPAAARSLGGFVTVYRPAPLWRRAAAAGVSVLLVGVGGAILLSLIGSLVASADVRAGTAGGLVVAAIFQAVTVGGVLGYFGLGWYRGASAGMRALGLHLVDRSSGDLPRVDQVLLRMAAGFWSIVLAPIGLLSAGLAADRRLWADRLSGTAVLHSTVETWWWTWNGAQWEPGAVATVPGVAQPSGRRQPAGRPERSRWTWTDALPIAVLQLPVAFVGELAVVRATRAVGLGRPEPSVGSLILDVVGYGCIALLIWLFLGLRRKAGLRDVGLRPLPWRWMAAAVPAVIVAYAAELVVGEIGDALLPASPPTQCHDIQSAYGTSLLLGLVGVAVVAPLVEEVLFRGVVFGWMRGRVPLPLAVAGSALVFAAAHVLYLQWTLLPPIFAIGCVLAVLYHYSRSLWPGIVVHAAINSVATLALFFGAVHC
jgi:membrane protease YdiL (CAAX protease family)/uncharacterized RDD family membrane protein YckC